MNKTGLVDVVYEKMGGTKKSAEDMVDLIFATIAGELKNGGEVTIAGFGSFIVKERKAREARNPRTGETVHVPATKAPKFRPGKALKEAVR
ncbi:MAG: HU family DNA-binding protein [Candidatus Niyogibacteria bacterium]|nr:MAG: HU family DNA-binding protein [Candidatus Niyogibacteria bacterium]